MGVPRGDTGEQLPRPTPRKMYVNNISRPAYTIRLASLDQKLGRYSHVHLTQFLDKNSRVRIQGRDPLELDLCSAWRYLRRHVHNAISFKLRMRSCHDLSSLAYRPQPSPITESFLDRFDASIARAQAHTRTHAHTHTHTLRLRVRIEKLLQHGRLATLPINHSPSAR
ncbi:hypothetical protein EVAR_87983_1 [Eumeta japonica]|uniref:Uncharacterized protein n=1 Tax=Eumeta variegata TaxID=151549 RepID=A0A4C1VEL7_EUMVA|nr:hypothetical protein EVAR_87983_1 [Eumeta japonica]